MVGRRPVQGQLGISNESLEAALAAIDAGAPIRDVLDRLSLGGVEREQARILFKNRRQAFRQPEADYETALTRLSRIRTLNIYSDYQAAVNHAVSAHKPLVQRFGELESDSDLMFQQLAVLQYRHDQLVRVGAPARSRLLLSQCHTLIAEMRATYAEMVAVLDQMNSNMRSMTEAADAALLRAGYTPKKVLELGGIGKKPRDLSRRQSHEPRADPENIGLDVDEMFGGLLSILDRFRPLENAARETITVRLANLQRRATNLSER